jgi:hypothetical protein
MGNLAHTPAKLGMGGYSLTLISDLIDSHVLSIPEHCQNEKHVGVMSASSMRRRHRLSHAYPARSP